MKKLMIAIAVAGLSAISCEFHDSSNGLLDGFWQVARIDTIATGGTLDTRDSNLSWAFHGNLFELRRNSELPSGIDVISRFVHQGDSLVLYDFYNSKRELGDIRITDVYVLRPFGIHSLRQRFTVERLDGSSMQVSTDSLRISLRRY